VSSRSRIERAPRVEASFRGTALALAFLAAAGCRIATVRPLDETAAPADAAARPFDAAAFVDSIWDSEVQRALAGARGLEEVVAEAARGAGADAGRPQRVVVRGRGRVAAVDTRSRSSTATIALDGKPPATVVLQVGPVLTGTAIRDALPALGFERFVNQIQHAEGGHELNARVERDVLHELDRATLAGRFVRFAGMAVLEAGRPLTVTPVTLEVEGRP
jgi:predicted lipoprotein